MKSTYFKYIKCFLILIHLVPDANFIYSQDIDSSKQIAYSFVQLQKPISSDYDDFAPYYFNEYDLLIYTSSRFSNQNQFQRQNILFSYKSDSTWIDPVYTQFPMNSKYNEGCFTYSKETQTIYFARTIKHNTDIYQIKAEISDSGIALLTEPEKCPVINSPFWDSEPSISKDGKVLYFASNRPGGFGKSDIWISRLDENSNWSQPENLGDKINSKGNEFAPFIFSDSNMFFFSSDGHPGFGGLDFFFSLSDKNSWTEPQNFEYLNSPKDELFIFLNDPNFIYYSSNKQSGNYKIYCAELQKLTRTDSSEMKRFKHNIYKASVSNIKTAQPINNYSVTITEKNDIIVKAPKIKTYRQNKFTAELSCSKVYSITVSSTEYLSYKEIIHTDSSETTITRDIRLNPVVSTFPINISFTDTMTTLNVYSVRGLDNAYNILYNNPGITAEIAVHTDSSLDQSKAIQLTWQRAESIRNYLIERGISPDRLKSKGYGFLEPLAPNITEEGRKMNRRVELRTQKK